VKKTSEAVFVVGEGSVTALAGGPLSLADMGQRRTRRVSTIEFSKLLNRWLVTDCASGAVVHQSDDYDEALQWERDHFNSLLATSPEILPSV
jgi:hypothetical protein